MAESMKDVDRPSPTAQKKVNIESLSHEELVKKCKNLLILSQKAKQAKDEATEELKNLKHELNTRCQETETHKSCSEKLAVQLRRVTEEKESVLTAVESIKLNNVELQNIVRNIGAERDALFEDVKHLNLEKQKLIQVLDSTGQENDSIIGENRTLKAEKRKLNEDLFSSFSEREAIDSEIKAIECKLNNLLQESGLLMNFLQIVVSPFETTDKVEGSNDSVISTNSCIANLTSLISIFGESFSTISSHIKSLDSSYTSARPSGRSRRDSAKEAGDGLEVSSNTVQAAEIERLRNILEEVESKSKVYIEENNNLKDEVSAMKSDKNQKCELFMKEANEVQMELRNEVEKCRKVSAEKTTEIALLRDEISLLMDTNKKQVVNLMEMKGLRNEIEKLKNLLTDKESEINMLKSEAGHMETINSKHAYERESYENKISDLQKLLDSREMETAIWKQEIQRAEEIQSKFSMEIEMLQNQTINLQKVVEVHQAERREIEENVLKLSHDISSCQKSLEYRESEIEVIKQERAKTEDENSKQCLEIKSLKKEMENLLNILDDTKREVETSRQEIVDIKKSNDSYYSDIELLQSEIVKAQKAREENERNIVNVEENVSEYSIEIETLKNEVKNLQKDLHGKAEEIVSIIQEREKEKETNMGSCLALETMQKEITNIQKHLDDKEQEIASMIEERMRIEENNSKYSLEIATLKNEMTNLQKVVEDERDKLTSMRKERDEIEEENTKFVSEIELLKSEIKNLKNMLAIKEKETVNVEECISKCNVEIEILGNEILDLKKIQHDKDMKIAVITQERQEMEQNSLKFSSEIESLKKYIVSLEALSNEREQEITKIVQENGAFKENNLKHLSEIETLKIEVTSLQKNLEESKHKMASITQEREEIIENNILNYSSGIEALQREISNMQTTLTEKELEISEMRSEKHILEEHNRKCSSEADALHEEVSNLQKQLESKEMEIKLLTERLQGTDTINLKYSSEIAELKENLIELNHTLQIKERELEEVCQEREEIERNSRECLESLSQVQRLNEEKTVEAEFLQSERQQYLAAINKMQKEYTEQLRIADERYNSKQENLTDELVNIRNSSAETEAALSQVRLEFEALKEVQAVIKRENSELLVEMNEMNQVLKKRGETVSKLKELNNDLEQKLREAEKSLETTLQDLQAKIIELESKDAEMNHLRSEVEQLSDQAKIKEVDNKELSDESVRLRNRIQQLEREIKDSGETASEVMSCSTLGRGEESSRLKDLEDTFEERYTKLRTIAVKLKKRVSELTIQVTNLEADKVKLSADLQSKLTQLSANAKNVQTIQHEYDKLQDLFEVQKQEAKATKKALELAVNDATAVKLCLQEINGEKDKLNKDLEFCTVAKLAVETQMKELKAEIQNLKKEKSEHDNEVKRLKEEIVKSDQKLKEEEQKHKETRNEFDTTKQEMKKNSLLWLEMNDFERSVADLSQQLTAERTKVTEVTSHLESQQEIAEGLQEQIKLLEEGLAAEETRSSEAEEQLNVLRLRLSEAAALSLERETDIHNLKTEVECRREESERAALQLSQMAAEKLKYDEASRLRADGFIAQVRNLEDELKASRSQLADKTKELSKVSAEFESYKVRAQSVLRQKVRPDDTSREDCVEEIAQLRHTADVTRTKLEETSSRLLAANAEIATLQQDRDRILERCRELSESVTNLTTQNQQLADKTKEMTAEHREAISKQKIHHETLVQCYKTQLEELEEKLTSENAILKDQLDRVEAKIRHSKKEDRLDNKSEPGKNSIGTSDSNKTWTNSGAAFVRVRSPVNEIAMLEREEGEGSESVDSTSPHNSSQNHHELIPLDKLLASNSEGETVCVTSISPGAELSKTRDQLNMSERQVRHLSVLLSEAEQDLAKLTQLNDMLKEEIRRNQRSEEREKHAHNQEYLKNVIFKFVTLQGGDERSRLVPVLNTLLKLSPDETKQLSSVARGGADPQGGRGWGNYLHLWPSTQ